MKFLILRSPRIGQAFVENLMLRNVNLSLNPLGLEGATPMFEYGLEFISQKKEVT